MERCGPPRASITSAASRSGPAGLSPDSGKRRLDSHQLRADRLWRADVLAFLDAQEAAGTCVELWPREGGEQVYFTQEVGSNNGNEVERSQPKIRPCSSELTKKKKKD